MRKVLAVFAVVILAAWLTTVPSMADWNEGDGHKMHFPQLPDEAGWDVNATMPLILADDWTCSESGWIKDIHFWGSWMHGDEGIVDSFVLSIHADIPANPPNAPYSRPGETLREIVIRQGQYVAQTITGQSPEGWFDPASGQFFFEDHVTYVQYNVFLEQEDWFWQEEETVYWLNISAIVANPGATQWGWKSSKNHHLDDAVLAFWYNLDWLELYEPPLFEQSLDLAFVITGGGPDTCEYYKPQYVDYAPQGMPDFDQKQDAYNNAQGWTHCGPTAAANCLWWFDSKFEPSPVDPRPFGTTPADDDYPLVSAPAGSAFDDHDPANVQPLISALATLMNTNGSGSGTYFMDFVNGFRQHISNAGLDPDYRDSIQPIPSYQFIREQVLDCQNVILLLGFYEDYGTHVCPVGWHYVTTAGVCTTAARICISDPYFDMLEGNPPGAPPHGGTVHNDANNISGPHGQIQHDPYDIITQILPGGANPVATLPGYMMSPSDIMQFEGQNNPGIDPCPYQGGSIYTVIDLAFVVCPDTVEQPRGACCYPDPTGAPNPLCTITTQDDCENALGGVYQGDDTDCGTVQACCLQDGSCVDVDSICCVNEMGGTPQGLGNNCSVNTIACCLPGGGCIDVDSLCCDEMGGKPSPIGAAACMGDNNGNTIDDACEVPQGACCFDDGSCQLLTQADCEANPAATYLGDGSRCLGDNNNNGVNDACESWQPDDPHKMHYPQLPDEAGWDVHATSPKILADDWRCTESGPVKDIHFWGSWKDGITGVITSFTFRIYRDIPADESPTEYSMPGEMVWEYITQEYNMIAAYPPTEEGWFNSDPLTVIPNDHSKYFQYDVFIPSTHWFPQTKDTIYWLSITAAVEDVAAYEWGWKSSINHFNDDAVWTIAGMGNWYELYEPPEYTTSLDLAFVITGGEEEPTGACCYPNPTGAAGWLCTVTTPSNCAALGGVYEGDGVPCGGMQACCLPDGSCTNSDSLCCVNELGGTPQGAGTTCGGLQACCLPDGTCVDADSICCVNVLNGVPQGAGTECDTALQACCLSDGSCIMADSLCCVNELGGTPQGTGTHCSTFLRPCCLPGGGCAMLDPLCCDEMSGSPSPIGAQACMGDADENGVDDACEPGWEPGDGHKMHFPQLPDEAGWDVNATRPQVLADDWQCSETGWIKDIHFWGSWRNGDVGEILWFVIGIWTDIPANPPDYEYSRPGEPLWEQEFNYFGVVALEAATYEGWYDPSVTPEGEVIANDHRQYFQYNIMLDTLDWVKQDSGRIYWLSINAIVGDPENTHWGWKSCIEGWNDDAVWANFGEFNWIDLWTPPEFDNSLNLSFVITGDAEPPGDTCEGQMPGDADGNGSISISDITYLTSYLQGIGPAPVPQANGDPNGDCCIDWWDLIYLTNYLMGDGPPPVECTCVNPPRCECFAGDANGDGTLNVGDAVYLINYVFKQGADPKPYKLCSGDANCDCVVNVGDAVFMINYVFKSGLSPCNCCDWIAKCGAPIRK